MKPLSKSTRALLATVALVLAACGGPAETPPQKAAARVAKAEAAMNACKERLGMAATPTPDTAVLDDPSKRGEPITTDLANQLRMKIQCRLDLDELLAARKAAAETK
jgi:hypothetical protein